MEFLSFLTTKFSNVHLSDLRFPPKNGNTDEALRPCQEHYRSSSTRRRPFGRKKRATKDNPTEPIFSAHNVTARDKDSGFRTLTREPTVVSLREELKHRQPKDLQLDCFTILKSLNSARHVEGLDPLILDFAVCDEVQRFADDLDDKFPEKEPRSTLIQRGAVSSVHGSNVRIRLISPPGFGNLACGELWASGKYKGYNSVKTGPDHRPESCVQCSLFAPWEVLVQPGWERIGIGRADGRRTQGDQVLEKGGGSTTRWIVDLVGRRDGRTGDIHGAEERKEVLLPPLPPLPSPPPKSSAKQLSVPRKAVSSPALRNAGPSKPRVRAVAAPQLTPPRTPSPVPSATSERGEDAAYGSVRTGSSWETVSTAPEIERAYLPQPLSWHGRKKYVGPQNGHSHHNQRAVRFFDDASR